MSESGEDISVDMPPVLSKKWKCYLFGSSDTYAFTYTPTDENVPNWFWRKMQYFFLRNRWVRVKDE